MAIDIVFEKPPGPDSQFVEVEDGEGNSIRLGEWIEREDGYHVLRFNPEELVVGEKVRLSIKDDFKEETEAPKVPGAFQAFAQGPWRAWSVEVETVAELQKIADSCGSVITVKFTPACEDKGGYLFPLLVRHESQFEKKKDWSELAKSDEGLKVRELCGDARLFGAPDEAKLEEARKTIIKTGSQLRSKEERLKEEVEFRLNSIRAMARGGVVLGALQAEGDSDFWDDVRAQVELLKANAPFALTIDNEIDNFHEWLDTHVDAEGAKNFMKVLLRSFLTASLMEEKLRTPDDSGLMDKISELAKKDRE